MSVATFPERLRVAVPCGCVLGEGPIWDERTGTLFWVDIDGESLWSWQPDRQGEATSRPVGERVGFVVLTPDPDVVLLGLKSGMGRLRLSRTDAPTLVLRPEPDRPTNRLNDGCAGPDGSLYFGSLSDGPREPTGIFHWWSQSGLRRMGEVATVTTNGPAIDPAARILYAADTSKGRIYRHRLAPDGTPGPAEDFVTFRPGDGHPDGLTVDADGHLWACHFGAGRITRFSPDGEPVLVVPVPTAQVTKVAFGGPDLATLYVTTAARGRDRSTDPLAGDLLAFEPGMRGLPALPCRMGLA